jgi:hypothetical protein
MGGGSEALLKVWRAPLDLFSESFEYKKKRNWFKYRFRCGSTLLEGEPMRCHRLLVNRFLNKIKKEISFIKKGSLQRRSRSPLKPIYRLDTSTLTLPPVGA